MASMDASIRLGRVAGIEVGLHWSLAIALVLIVWTLAGQVFPDMVPDQPQSAYWLVSLLAALLFYVSLLSHEMGHALVARRLGVSVEGITLWIFGGVARLGGDAATAGAEARIAIAGPIVSLVLAVAFGLITLGLDAVAGPPLIDAGCFWLALSNGTLLLFNLIPAFPLDGGRILRAWLWGRRGNRYRATATAAALSRGCSFVMIAIGLLGFFLQQDIGAVWVIFIGLFLLSAARNEEAYVLMHGALAGLRVSDVMSRDPMVAPGWITVEEFMRTYLPIQRAAAYPIKTFEGNLDGLVTLTRLAEVPSESRRATRVRDVGVGLDAVPQARPAEPVAAILNRFGSGDGHVLVLEGGRLVGIVSPPDVTRALGETVLRRDRERTSS
ncbi:MAG: CBS domain-containing protein [Chloroflexi bacterium]|nr:MAG: CBS domain-containing protein [Chloroflexota bacterium]